MPKGSLFLQHEMTMSAVIRADNLVKRYGRVTALQGATFEIPAGCTGLAGPNGAGKTTLIRILIGLARADSGTCSVLGLEPARHGREIRRQIGFVPEDDAYWEGLTAVGAVQYAGRLCGIPSPDALKRAHRLLDEAGLGEERYRLMETFSMGMRQKVRLAQALVHSPRLLILDEPTRFLDPSARRDFSDWGKDLLKTGIPVLISTHELSDIERLCDRVVILTNGGVTAILEMSKLQGRSIEWEVQAVGEPLEMQKALDQLKIQNRRNGDIFSITLDSNECTLVIKNLTNEGIKIRRIMRKIPSLNEILPQHLGKEIG